jgi:RimJ/RimL family protein N-acetyltransferase
VTIELERVLLRRPEPKDVEQLYQYRNDWNVIRQLGGFSSGYSLRDISDWIEYHRAQKDEIIWTIADKKEDRCLGHVGLYRIDHRIRKAEFAILIGNSKWWRKGLGQEVSRGVLDFAFRELNLHRVELTVLATNSAAIHLYRKLGFTEEGVIRQGQFRDGEYVDIVTMGLLEHEWRESKNT